MYPYHCTECGEALDVLRDIDDRNRHPTDAEAAACTNGTHIWVRKIAAPKVAFGESWSGDGRGMKGRH